MIADAAAVGVMSQNIDGAVMADETIENVDCLARRAGPGCRRKLWDDRLRRRLPPPRRLRNRKCREDGRQPRGQTSAHSFRMLEFSGTDSLVANVMVNIEIMVTGIVP